MSERWEHYALEAGMFRGERFLHGLSADGVISVHPGGPLPGEVLPGLNNMGGQGWQLVSMERDTDDNGWTRRYWLKRRLN